MLTPDGRRIDPVTIICERALEGCVVTLSFEGYCDRTDGGARKTRYLITRWPNNAPMADMTVRAFLDRGEAERAFRALCLRAGDDPVRLEAAYRAWRGR